MRIMVDTNIIISAGLFPESIVGKIFSHILKTHKLVLCQHTLDELTKVFKNKFPERLEYLNEFTGKLKYELIDIDIKEHKKYPSIRDHKDMPILASAIEAGVNLLITGDKDFDEIVTETPLIIKPKNYAEEYMK